MRHLGPHLWDENFVSKLCHGYILQEVRDTLKAGGPEVKEMAEGLAKLDAGTEQKQRPIEETIKEVAEAMGLEESPQVIASCRF